MRTVTATEFARNFRIMLNNVEFRHEEFVIVRNNHEVARIIPGLDNMTAMEVMSDLYGILTDDAALGWLESSRQLGGKLDDEVHNPWDF